MIDPKIYIDGNDSYSMNQIVVQINGLNGIHSIVFDENEIQPNMIVYTAASPIIIENYNREICHIQHIDSENVDNSDTVIMEKELTVCNTEIIEDLSNIELEGKNYQIMMLDMVMLIKKGLNVKHQIERTLKTLITQEKITFLPSIFV